MDSRTRIQTAFAFKEPDRVPIELSIDSRAHRLPEAERLVRFVETDADNIASAEAIDWGFFGLAGRYSEEIIEERPGDYRRIRRTWETPVGPFFALTKHNYPHLDSSDYHWERRYIETFDDMVRMAHAPREATPAFDRDAWRGHVERLGTRGVPAMGLWHPLGTLVRMAKMEESYGWLLTEPETMHAFAEDATRQVVRAIEAVGRQGVSPWFLIYAHEMFVPPWMGLRLFDEWIVTYDTVVNDAIHRIGGRLRSHCHGNCMQFLERMADMGVDAVEPLEPPPFADVELREAKRRVGERMVLSGNIPSQDFIRLRPDEVRRMVKDCISAGAPGGGFSLRTTGGDANVDMEIERESLIRIIANAEAYVEAGLEYGRYPIRV